LQLLGFENFSSNEFFLHLNETTIQNYLRQFSMEAESVDVVNNNILLKTALGAMVYLIIYLSQRTLNFLIYERFIVNCLQQFIDVSSIANISVLILLNSYGFYIHGRSGN
jgi:alpha-amylase/alpha-mannosidase (GH57 family)